MSYIRRKLTYSNVMVTILALVVLGGGTAFAASQMLPKNSVGPKQLKKGAVTPSKLSPAAMTVLTGPRGQQGPTGVQGPAGPAGPTGPAASSISQPLPHARIRLRSHEQTVGDRANPRIYFDQVVEDNAGMADIVAHPTTLMAPRTGLYAVNANLEWYNLEGEGRVGGSLMVPSADGIGNVPDKSQVVYDFVRDANLQFVAQPFAETIRLAAGQFVALTAFQDTGATNQVTNTDDGTWLEMTYLGP
jgi:hypothetical protein